MKKVALVEIPVEEVDNDYVVTIFWDEINIPEDHWVDMEDYAYETLVKYITACKGYDAHKWKATKNSVFKNYKVVVCHTPEVIDTSMKKALELAKEYKVVAVKKEAKAKVSTAKRKETILKNKHKKLKKLQEELGVE